MARAKETGRAEARRRYRQASGQEAGVEGTEDAAEAPVAARGSKPEQPRGARSQQPQAPARPGFTSAFRAAYHPAHVREDIAALPQLVRHFSFFVPVLMILVGGVVASVFSNYTGGALAWQLLLAPGSGFGLPQLVAGFFALRASYLLGFIVSLVQGIVSTVVLLTVLSPASQPFPSDQIPSLLVQAFIAGPVTGTLFAAAAAWYRRFLALSGPKRTATNTRNQSRSSSRGGARR